MSKSFNEVDVSNIYVCMGSFRYDNKNRVLVHDDNYSWREYMCLEQATGDNYEHVLKKDCEQFENEHIVLHPKPNYDAIEFYKKVRNYYLNEMIKNGYEDASLNTKQKFYK